MSDRFRLGVSGSSFIYAMPHELVAASIIAAQRDTASVFDDRQNRMMAEFMRDMMHAVNSSSIAAMECYHSLSWSKELIMDEVLDDPRVELWSVHAPYGNGSIRSSPDERSREGALAACIDAVDVARRIGARIVVVHPGADVPYDETARCEARYAVEGPEASSRCRRGERHKNCRRADAADGDR
jgi:endonuclease IV